MKSIKIQKIILLVGIIAILTIFILPTMQTMAADEGYKLLAPLPGLETVPGSDPLAKYIPFMFNLLIGLSAAAAVLMIVIGGLQYISTDAVLKKSEGKERIKNAVFSLVLIIGSWLILNEINPNLLKINLESFSPKSVTIADLGGTLNLNGAIVNLNTHDQLLAQDAASVTLTGGGFTIGSSGGCTDHTNSSCTSVEGMHSDTVMGLIDLKNGCGNACDKLFITGGTEVGHAEGGLSHESGFKADISNTKGDGAAFVDFLDQQVKAQYGEYMTPGGFYNITVGGDKYQVHPEKDHMDIVVIPK